MSIHGASSLSRRYLIALLFLCTFFAAHHDASAATGCPALEALRNKPDDIGPALSACVNQIQMGGDLALVPGQYHLATPVDIGKSITIHSAGLNPGVDPHCWDAKDSRCATIIVGVDAGSVQPGWYKHLPIEVTGDHVTIHHLVIAGARGKNLKNDAALCLNPATKSLGGGLRILGGQFSLLDSSIVRFVCYSAFEVRGKDGLTMKDDFIGYNGDHSKSHMWSDGATIVDSEGAVVQANTFVDNTDVQLILGGCQHCTVSGNSFRHDANLAGGSFADLMLHAWPHTTSGNFDGTAVTDNQIDCGPHKACGFGIQIGPDPWYPRGIGIRAPTAGGSVSHNKIQHAMLAINVDNLSGPMQISDNTVTDSGGQVQSSCGLLRVPAVNISPKSQQFINIAEMRSGAGVSTSNQEFANCVLNHDASLPSPH